MTYVVFFISFLSQRISLAISYKRDDIYISEYQKWHND
ncbi:hypothetical protein PLIP_a0760 [Pseudoalteromonas lipolytica LMEB 39]|nr:hypothetical protein [Pseudoalteromonas lipolytica LMEB 39]